MHQLDAIATPSGGSAATTAVRIPVDWNAGTGRRKRLFAASAVALALLLGGGALWLRRSQPATSSSTSAPDQIGATLPAADTVIPSGPAAPPTPTEAKPAPLVTAGRGEVERSKPERSTRQRGRAPRQQPASPTQESAGAVAAADSLSVVESTAAPPVMVPSPALPPPVPPAESTPAARPAPAPAPVPPPRPADPLPEIRGVIAEYAKAIEAKSLDRLRRTYPGMLGIQERGWEQFFQLVRDVKADLSVGKLNLSGGTAEGQVTGTYTYLNTSTGRTERQPVSFHASFKNQAGQWRIAQVR
jgi:hypothetical protein